MKGVKKKRENIYSTTLEKRQWLLKGGYTKRTVLKLLNGTS